MKTLNPVEDLITETARLYFELCQLAKITYDMGQFSGAKRTILLFLGQQGSVRADDLAHEFPDPAQAQVGSKIVSELQQSGLIKIDLRQGHPYLSLTQTGQEKVHEIIKYESALIKQLPSELTVAELRKTVKTMESFRESMEDLRARKVSPHSTEIAS